MDVGKVGSQEKPPQISGLFVFPSKGALLYLREVLVAFQLLSAIGISERSATFHPVHRFCHQSWKFSFFPKCTQNGK